MEDFGNLETTVTICLSAGALCLVVVLGGGMLYLFNLRDRGRRKAAQSWSSTTGRVIDSRVAHQAYFQLGITEAEAQARMKSIKDSNKPRPADALAAVLNLFGDAGALAGDLITDPGARDTGDWPLVVYEYEVDGVKYASNRVRVEDKHEPSMGGVLYSGPLLKRYPKGATVTVYYNPQDPKESALER